MNILYPGTEDVKACKSHNHDFGSYDQPQLANG